MSRPGSDTSVQVRAVGADDWRSCRDIRLRALQDSPDAFGSTYDLESGFTEDQWRTRLAGPDHVSVLAYWATAPIGMGAGFQDLPGLLHVVAMWVDPSARGRGVGPQVLDVIRGWAQERGLGLHLDVHTGNTGARRSYERYGFVATGELRPLRDGSAELVERMLLPPNRDATSLSGRRGCR
jgi:GNAT superfamily N-acetyltransferase